jgi:hypothetical protein
VVDMGDDGDVSMSQLPLAAQSTAQQAHLIRSRGKSSISSALPFPLSISNTLTALRVGDEVKPLMLVLTNARCGHDDAGLARLAYRRAACAELSAGGQGRCATAIRVWATQRAHEAALQLVLSMVKMALNEAVIGIGSSEEPYSIAEQSRANISYEPTEIAPNSG